MEINVKETKEQRLERLLNLYEQQSKANCIEMYFIVNKTLYKRQMNRITTDIVNFGITSKSKGHKEVIRMRLLKAKKLEWLENEKVTEVMSEKKFLELSQELKLNKGQTCEYLSCRARKIEYKLDSTRYDKAGDVDLKRKRIQVKFENASIAVVDTILKIAKASA